MKQVLLGTVSALALTLAVTGGAMADGDGNLAVAASAANNAVVFNAAVAGLIFSDNEIDENAFQSAAGAFNVGQNQSINSSVQQSMAIGAVISNDSSDQVKGDDQTSLAVAGGGSAVLGNLALLTGVFGANELEDNAFEDAKGAFNVLQNRSINSGVSQSMAIAAVVSGDRDGDANPFENTAVAASGLGSITAGNIAALTAVGAPFHFNQNQITDHAFQNARGAFNVLQNASVNSSVQQSMAIGAIVNK